MFVLIGCPEAAITDRKSYYQPIVGMLEVEIALNKNEVLWQTIINDYREFLEGICKNWTHFRNGGDFEHMLRKVA